MSEHPVKIKLSAYGDEAHVAPSRLHDGRVLVGFFAVNGAPTHPAVFSTAEWDAFVASGNAALGRTTGPTGPTVPRSSVSGVLPLLIELRSVLPFGRASRLVDIVSSQIADALGVNLPAKDAPGAPRGGTSR